MKNLICADLLKLRRSLGYKILLLALLSLSILSWFVPAIMYDNKTITGLYYLQRAVLDFQAISPYVAIFAGIFISSEFVNRTYATAVSAGNKRFSIFFSKVVVFLIGLLPMVVSSAAPMVLLASIRNGFATQSDNPHILSGLHDPRLLNHYSDSVMNHLASVGIAAYTVRIVILSLLLALVIGCLHILLAFCIKNVAGTIGAGIFITFLLEHLQRFYVGNQRFREILSDIFTHRAELTPIYVIVCVILTAAMLCISFKAFQKTELK
jgi:hypothetical protein